MELEKRTKISLEDLEKMIDNAQSQQFVAWDKEMLISYKLECGFTITGRGAVVKPENFSEKTGRKVCREDAIAKLWQLEGYRLQWKLYEQAQQQKE